MGKEPGAGAGANLSPIDWEKFIPAPVIGVDEVGRGCLAGPVYAAAVILPNGIPTEYTDSKLLSAVRRQELSKHIYSTAEVCVAFATVEEIDRLNILRASLLAMSRAVLGLGYKNGHVVVDGHMPIADLPGFKQTTVVKGDLRVQPIAAASIVAKVARDGVMCGLDQEFPGYGFADHKGYATQAHRTAIARLGPCPQHRSTFAGVREYLGARAATL